MDEAFAEVAGVSSANLALLIASVVGAVAFILVMWTATSSYREVGTANSSWAELFFNLVRAVMLLMIVLFIVT